jgi:hypothetical protein
LNLAEPLATEHIFEFPTMVGILAVEKKNETEEEAEWLDESRF